MEDVEFVRVDGKFIEPESVGCDGRGRIGTATVRAMRTRIWHGC